MEGHVADGDGSVAGEGGGGGDPLFQRGGGGGDFKHRAQVVIAQCPVEKGGIGGVQAVRHRARLKVRQADHGGDPAGGGFHNHHRALGHVPFRRFLRDFLDILIDGEHHAGLGVSQGVDHLGRDPLQRLAHGIHRIGDGRLTAAAVQVFVEGQLHAGQAVETVPVHIAQQMGGQQAAAVPHRHLEQQASLQIGRDFRQGDNGGLPALQPLGHSGELLLVQHTGKGRDSFRRRRDAQAVFLPRVGERAQPGVINRPPAVRHLHGDAPLLIRRLGQIGVGQTIDLEHHPAQDEQQQGKENKRAFFHGEPVLSGARVGISSLPGGDGF